ncbi:MAG: M20/M25/M40 family metallo-hydrolase, partial [Planctomycetota bacterium]
MSLSLLSLRNVLVPVLICAVASAQEAPTDSAAVPDEATPMEEVIAAIIDEGKNNSEVWETLTYISEEIGPRLTGSSALERANVWSRDRFTELGLSGARLHRWGEVPVRFDRGPSSVRMIGPVEREIEFTTRAWGAGTDGPLRGRVVKEPKTMEEFEAISDQLEGAWLLSKEGRRRRNRDRDAAKAEREERKKVEEALKGFTFLGKLRGSSRDEITTGGVRGWRELTMETLPTEVEITIRRQDYDAINSRLSDGEEVEIEADLKHYFTEGPFGVFNTIAEIRGTEFPDEVVIISAHLDSWNGPGSQGTQDNGTGSSVTLETARILMAAGVQPRRTIRFCLWSGEEQGLLGSRGYVESLTDDELKGISACFVDDGGTYYQGGLFCVASMEP